MCNAYSIKTTSPDLMRALAAIGPIAREALPPSYRTAPNQEVPIVVADAGQRVLHAAVWGLVAPWADEPRSNVKYPTFNARIETIAEKRTYKEPFVRRRCLVPADGYFEFVGTRSHKTPYWFHLPDRPLFAFAGLWNLWPHSGPPMLSTTIVTGPANDRVSEIHDRMPIILQPDAYDLWLDPDMQDADTARALLDRNRNGELNVHRVRPKPRANDPTAIEPA